MVWSCFISEFALSNPTMITQEMMGEILSIINNDKAYAKNIIFGYIQKAELLASESLNRTITYKTATGEIKHEDFHTKINNIKRSNPLIYK